MLVFGLVLIAVGATVTATAPAFGLSCEDAKIEAATTYTPPDAQILTHIPFVVEFALTCKGSAVADASLFAAVDGETTVQVTRAKDGLRYQVGWTKETKRAKHGTFDIRIYDEDGYSALKRVLDRGGDAASARSLGKISINYKGSYAGSRMRSEFVAMAASLLVFYSAFSAKRKLLT